MKIIKRKVPSDPAFGKQPRFRYSVGSWDFPTKTMAEEFLRKQKRRSK
jgi:hypothetical protein